MPLIIFLILEIIVFALVASAVGWGWALLLIVLGSFAGLLLLRFSNMKIAQKLQQRMATGELPVEEMMQFPFQMIAGFLLFIPGFITDILAIICLIPSIRLIILRKVMRSNHFQGRVWTARRSSGQSHRSPLNRPPANDDQHTIEGEFWQDNDQNDKN